MSKNTCRCSEPGGNRKKLIVCRHYAVDNTFRWLRGVTIYYCVRCGKFWLEEIREVDFQTLNTRTATDWVLLEGQPVSWTEMRERKHDQVPKREDCDAFVEYGDNVTMKQYNHFAPVVIIEKAQQAYENAVKKGQFYLSEKTWNADIPPIHENKQLTCIPDGWFEE